MGLDCKSNGTAWNICTVRSGPTARIEHPPGRANGTTRTSAGSGTSGTTERTSTGSGHPLGRASAGAERLVISCLICDHSPNYAIPHPYL